MTSSFLPWIHQADTGPGKVGRIPGDHRQPVHQRSRREIGVDRWKSANRHQLAPTVGHLFVDRENIISIAFMESREPLFESRTAPGCLLPQEFDSPADFPKADDTHALSNVTMIISPTTNAPIRFRTLPQLGQHIGVDQVRHQNCRSRCPSVSWIRSRSNSVSGLTVPSSESKKSRSVGFVRTGRLKTSLRIRRCSSSAETPCSAARRFNFRTSVSSKFRTNNCAMPESAITDSHRQQAVRSQQSFDLSEGTRSKGQSTC